MHAHSQTLTGYGVYIQVWAHPKNFLDFEFDGLYEWPMDTDSMDSQLDPLTPIGGRGTPLWSKKGNLEG